MKKRWTLWTIVLLASVAAGPAAHSNITPVNYPTPMSFGASHSGVVTNIDPVNHFVQIREASGMVQTIRVDNHIEILRNGAPVTFSNLSIGDSVILTAASNP